ncbi:MAG: hypothetical protein J6T10_22465 [Methanobrevibacter sp.]|nr:hypothetical protein [Methanobrevibacter sp.]
MTNKIVIGIDQSYKDTGISVSYNGKLMSATHCYTENLKSNSKKRECLRNKLLDVFSKIKNISINKNANVIIIIERIRLRSQGFINIDYIKSIGALNALIVDLSYKYNFPVYSVDTRAWKSSIVGTSKGQKNKYGFDEKKYPTILWCKYHGYEKYIKQHISSKKKKGVIELNGERFTYNDNIADSICISLYGFIHNPILRSEH